MKKTMLKTDKGQFIVETITETDRRRNSSRYKVHVGDVVTLDKKMRSVKNTIMWFKKSGLSRLRKAAGILERKRMFKIASASYDGQNSLYTLESLDGEYCGQFGSYALTAVKDQVITPKDTNTYEKVEYPANFNIQLRQEAQKEIEPLTVELLGDEDVDLILDQIANGEKAKELLGNKE
jgi:hypothetical protein